MSYAIYLRKSRADAEAEARGEGEISIGHTASLSFCAHYRQFSARRVEVCGLRWK